jgi:hypothetical protein
MYLPAVPYLVIKGSTELPLERCVPWTGEASVSSLVFIVPTILTMKRAESTLLVKLSPLLARLVRMVGVLSICPKAMILAESGRTDDRHPAP